MIYYKLLHWSFDSGKKGERILCNDKGGAATTSVIIKERF